MRLVLSASAFRQASMFQASFHSIRTSRMFCYAPPDTGGSDLMLVAVERLPSIEGIVEIQMDVTFLRGSFLYLQAWGFPQVQGFPYEGKLPPEAADEVDSAAETKLPPPHPSRLRRATFPS